MIFDYVKQIHVAATYSTFCHTSIVTNIPNFHKIKYTKNFSVYYISWYVITMLYYSIININLMNKLGEKEMNIEMIHFFFCLYATVKVEMFARQYFHCTPVHFIVAVE